MSMRELEVNKQGRVTIPKTLRDRLGIHAGSRLVAREEDGRLILEDPAHMLRGLQDRLSSLRADGGAAGLASEELIADRAADTAWARLPSSLGVTVQLIR